MSHYTTPERFEHISSVERVVDGIKKMEFH